MGIWSEKGGGEKVKYLGRIGAVSVVVLLSLYYAVSYYLHYGELKLFEFSGDLIYIALAWWGGLHFDKTRVLAKELQRKQQELLNILEFNVDAVVIRDLEGLILEVNPAYEKMTGYTQEEVIGKLVPFIEGGEEDIKQLIQEVLEKGKISGFKVVQEKKNGEIFYGNISFTLIRDNKGNPERIVGINRDITEQEKDERALKESEERYRTLVEFCPDAIFVHSEGKIVFANKAGYELVGARHENDLQGKSIWILVDQEYRKLVEERIKVSRETQGVSSLVEERFISLDGRKLSVEVATMAIMYMGKQANQVIVRDITDKKRMEKELRKQDERLRKITNNMSDLLVQIDERLHFEYVSTGSYKLLGHDSKELLNISILELVHPDDIEVVKKGIQKITTMNSQVTIEFRMMHANNYYLWLESIGSGMFDEQTDELTGYTIVSRNITDRKENEELIHKQDRLLQGVSKATNLLLTIPDYEKAMDRTLSMLGHMVDADRVYIFENKNDVEDDLVISLRFEWVNEFIESQLNNPVLQNLSYRKLGFTRWYDELSRSGMINDTVKDCPESEMNFLEKYGIQAVLAMPIFMHGTYWGFIGFDNCTKAKRWSKNEEMILRVAASGIGGAIERKQRETVLQEALIEKQISEQKLKETNEILKRHSSLDGLTGIANRRYFDEYLEQAWNKAVEEKNPLGLIMLDIDFFKKYNDTYGHLGGDECLKQVVSVLAMIAKQFGAIPARYGGEEFAVILTQSEREEVLKIAEIIRAGVEEMAIPHLSSEISNFVTVSVGVSICYPTAAMKSRDLIQSADVALYDSKRLGRNRVCECDYLYIS